jgi:hypothetical protein
MFYIKNVIKKCICQTDLSSDYKTDQGVIQFEFQEI